MPTYQERLFKDEALATHDTTKTDFFVDAANAHIDALYAKGMRAGEAFFHAVATYLSQINTEQKNGGPFGAVIVEFEGGLDEKGNGVGKPHVVGIGANHVVPNNDPSAHAEMEAYRDAAKRTGSSDLKGAKLYTSCECCPMCLGIANGAGIGSISYINTREHAEKIGFSDKLQYDMFSLPRESQMTSIATLGENRRADLIGKLGSHEAVVLDANGEVFATGDTDTKNDPTGVASIRAVRAAVARQAKLQKESGDTAPVFCLPAGFTLLTRNIPHPSGLITADWARMLRTRDAANPDDLSLDSRTPDASRIIHVTNEYEQLPVTDGHSHSHILQSSEVTYRQAALPDSEREVKTSQYEGPVVASAAKKVFDDWNIAARGGEQVRY